ncbi:MAG: GNAT family N-acetyltransferase [Phycisphaerales bacterium]|nr:GNAT family N-acetyltransferase [Phycisphaerales bacterium]
MAILEDRPISLKSGERITLRSARPDDAPGLVSLAADAFATSDFLGAGPEELDPDPAADRAKIAEFEANPTWLALVAFSGQTPIGRLNFRGFPKLRAAHSGQLGMYTATGWRGRGAGRALLSTLIDWARAHPTLETVCLGVMAPNTPAIRLYESFGFRREEWRIRQFRFGPGRYCDDIKMYLPVKPETGAVDPYTPEPIDLHGPPPGPLPVWRRTAPFEEVRRARLPEGEPLIIRRAREEDAAALVELGDDILSTSDYNLTTPEEFRQAFTEAKEREWVREMRDGPGNLALIAEIGGRLVGSASFRAESRRRMAHWGFFSIGIAREWRGRGVGRLLIETLLDWGVDHPTVEKICLGVLGPNVRAFRLYRAMGFAVEGYRYRGIRFAPERYADGVQMYQFVKPL